MDRAASLALGTRAAPPLSPSLGPWLKLLWNEAPPLHRCADDGPDASPHLDAQGLHLPSEPPVAPASAAADARLAWQQACAAHAAAHRVYSAGLQLPMRGLVPITRALIGLLEDLRVEALALRELPGLRRWWQPWHVATPVDGDGVEALLGRLSRALFDADYADPHPWIAKGRALVWVDAAQQVLALRQPADLRRIASRLGHDLGQMRLGFDARRYRPVPAYRDDHRWLWRSDETREVAPQLEPPVDPRPSPDAPASSLADALGPVLVERHYPEWDRLIARWRPRWCRVVELEPGLDAARPGAVPSGSDARRLLRRWPATGSRPGPAGDVVGELLDLDAAIDAAVRRRAGLAPDERIWRGRGGPREAGATLLLIDASASSAAPCRPGPRSGVSVLDAARTMAGALGEAAARRGEPLAIQAFASDGRQTVRVQRIKDYAEPWGDAPGGRLAALRSGWSTRLGAAIRHAADGLRQRPGARRQIVVLTDGDAHDVDLHDPRYLRADARQAVAEARRAGLRVYALALGPADRRVLQNVFGVAHSRVVPTAAAGLPVLARWLA